MTVVAQTDRLQLCQFTVEDAPFILQLVNDPSWLQFIGDRGIHTLAQAGSYLQDGPLASYVQHGYGLYRVQRKVDGLSLGMCGLVKRPSLPQPDIGFAFLPKFTGHGYAFEAATAVLHHAKTDLNLPTVLAITMPENHRSIKLLQKLGLHFQKMVSVEKDKPEVMLFQQG